jgi:hypothetical protein
MRSVLQAIHDARSRGNDRSGVTAEYLERRRENSVLGSYEIDELGDTSLQGYGAFGVTGGRLRFERTLDDGSD